MENGADALLRFLCKVTITEKAVRKDLYRPTLFNINCSLTALCISQEFLWCSQLFHRFRNKCYSLCAKFSSDCLRSLPVLIIYISMITNCVPKDGVSSFLLKALLLNIRIENIYG